MLDSRLSEIRDEVNRLAAVVGAHPSQLPTYGSSLDFARPHIEVHDDNYHWVVVERGHEADRRVFTSLDDLLYQVFSSVTFALATDWELRHRTADADSRRELFRRQEELLAQLDQSWAHRERVRHEEILRSHPFDDSSGARVALSLRLRAEGLPADVAWRRACKSLPLPRTPGQ